MDDEKTYRWLTVCKWYLVFVAVLTLINFVRVYSVVFTALPLTHLFSAYTDRVLALHPELDRWKAVLTGVFFLGVSPVMGLLSCAVCILCRKRVDWWRLIAGCGIASLFLMAVEHAFCIAFFFQLDAVLPTQYVSLALVTWVGFYFRKVYIWRREHGVAIVDEFA